jgi:hypothetical protein
MNHGPAWIVLEEPSFAGEKKLVSIVPARTPFKEVARLVSQMYVDRFGSLDERLKYKKSPKRGPFVANVDRCNWVIHIGGDPIFIAVYAIALEVRGELLMYQYQIKDESETVEGRTWRVLNRSIYVGEVQ